MINVKLEIIITKKKIRSFFLQNKALSFQATMDGVGVIDPTGIVDGLNAAGYALRGQKANAIIAAAGIIPYFGDLGKATKYTKSSLKMEREVHKAYKAAEHAPELGKFKEFTGIKGIRPDFVDIPNKTIYELKPYNPRGKISGDKQLEKYKKAFEAEYPGTVWKTVLDRY